MPKATTAPALRRNQACRQCRKRKLKCDASRPHCGTCVRQWNAQVSVPPPVGFSHPKEPQCNYDPVEGLQLAGESADDPSDRIRVLENQIAELQAKLGEAQHQQSRSVSPNAHYLSVSPPGSHSSLASPSNGSLGNPLHSSAHGLDVKPFPSSHEIALPQASLNIAHGHRRNLSSGSDISRMDIPAAALETVPHDSFMDLLFLGWNPDLPDPSVLNHLIDAFFRCDPCGSRIIHRPSFLASMCLPPTHPDFPHPALLHAICASASRWISQDINAQSQPTRRDRFAEFHASKTRSYIDRTMSTGAQIFSVVQACIILSWWFYAEGRWVEVWIFAAFQTRVSIPLGLNHPNAHSARPRAMYLEPPKTPLELESRRRVWWMSLVFDRIVSCGGWLHSVDERDIGTELPLRQMDFESEVSAPNNPQDLFSPSVLTTHPVMYTDPFILVIKGCMLFGKVTDYNSRLNLRNIPPAPGEDRRLDHDFRVLDKLVSIDFLASFPPIFKNCLGVGECPDGAHVDTDLYIAHLIPHAAAITLHVPHLDAHSPNCPSVARCLASSRSILNAYYLLCSTTFDITRLHPFVATAWYLAAVVQVHYCKHLIEVGDSDAEATAWGEINLMRYALIQYGSSSPIGIRQEKLLRDAMTEILQMTTQAAPLSVRVPLYPFSHAVFHQSTSSAEEDLVVAAPLPTVTPEETIAFGQDDIPPAGQGIQWTANEQSMNFVHPASNNPVGYPPRSAVLR